MRYWFYVNLLMLGNVGVADASPRPMSFERDLPGSRSQEPRFVPLIGEAQAPAKLRQTISLDVKEWPLSRALDEVVRRLGVPLIYDTTVTNYKRSLVLKFENVTGARAILDLLRDTGLQLEVAEDGSAARIRRVAGSRVLLEADTTGIVIGRITDMKTGLGVATAEVLLEGTRWRTTTDTAGRYRLEEITRGTFTLTARRLGYAKQSRPVMVRAGSVDTLDLSLTALAVKLDELVTTATGQQRRRDLGNAITTIQADSVMRTAPIRSLTDLLDNRVPGLNVQHTSGAPGDPARLRLRGISSVTRGNDPVVIVDGIRIYATQSDPRSGNLTNLADTVNLNSGPLRTRNLAAPSPLDQIDPNIIEKVEVFKGPSAATLYGADAANGVIVITTKRGRVGPARWNASLAHGRTTIPGRWPEGYYRWGHVPVEGNLTRVCTVVDLRCVPDSLVRFQALNQPDLTPLGRGRRTALSLTASGGSQALTYSITGSYDDETGLLALPAFEAERFRTRFNREVPDWMERPHRLQKWSVTSNVQALLGPTANVTLSTTLARTDQQRSTLEDQVGRLAGIYVDRVNGLYYVPGPLTDPTSTVGDENLDGVFSSPGLDLEDNYLTEFYRRTTASAITFTTGLNASWHPRPWFNASARAGLNVIPRDDQLFLPAGLASATDSGGLILGVGRSLMTDFSVQGTIRKPLGWGGFAFEASIGTNLTNTTTNDLVSSAVGLQPGTSTLAGARTVRATDLRVNSSVFGWYVEPRLVGQRLSLSTGIRLDGGSAHGARLTQSGGIGNLLSLPKLNGSWVISEEPFFPFKNVFSSLRLRAAYGQAQVQPGAADRLRLYTGRTTTAGDRLDLTNLGNTELRPERSIEFEGGLDADLFDSRVSVEFTAYRKTQVDALMPVELPLSLNGGGSVIQNVGNIRNQGLDLMLGVTPIHSSGLTWRVDMVYNRNSNTLVKLGQGVVPSKDSGLVEGYPVRGRWAKPILGYTDRNGNGVLEPAEIQVGDSLVYMGRLFPDYTAALFTNVTLFGGMVGITAGFSYDAGATQIDQTARTNWVLARALADPSAPLSEQAAVLTLPKTDYGLVQDVSTFRFNSLSVSYNAPARVAHLLRAQQLTIGVQGSNLGLHSSYRGMDPDVNSWSPGETIADTGQLPQSRTWQLAMYLQY